MSTSETAPSDSTFALPVVDFESFRDISVEGVIEGTEDKDLKLTVDHESVVKALDDACRNHGFVCLRNSGISKALVQEIFSESESLFELSQDQKSKFLALDPKKNIGYKGYQQEALNRRRRADLKETFNIKRPNQENYPGFEGTTKGFQQTATGFWEAITSLSKKFSLCCALALGLEPDYYVKTLRGMDMCTLRLNHYPPCPPASESQENDPSSAIRVGEHTDFGLFTFLFIHNLQDSSSNGLQIKSIEGGDLGCGSLVERKDEVFLTGWKDVVFDAETLTAIETDETCTLLVNTGALMARWTNDTWQATAHRVVVKPEARNSSRYSIAGFFDPDESTVCSVHPKFVPDGEGPKYPPITSSDYLLMKLQEAQG